MLVHHCCTSWTDAAAAAAAATFSLISLLLATGSAAAAAVADVSPTPETATRCYCNEPSCVTTGYMCKSSTVGYCYTQLSHDASSHVVRSVHGCVETLPETVDYGACVDEAAAASSSGLHLERDLQALRSRRNSVSGVGGLGVDAVLLCCRTDMCNYMDSASVASIFGAKSPSSAAAAAVTNSSSSAEDAKKASEEVDVDPDVKYDILWLRMSIIVVPLVGLCILVPLVVVAFHILTSDRRRRTAAAASASGRLISDRKLPKNLAALDALPASALIRDDVTEGCCCCCCSCDVTTSSGRGRRPFGRSASCDVTAELADDGDCGWGGGVMPGSVCGCRSSRVFASVHGSRQRRFGYEQMTSCCCCCCESVSAAAAAILAQQRRHPDRHHHHPRRPRRLCRMTSPSTRPSSNCRCCCCLHRTAASSSSHSLDGAVIVVVGRVGSKGGKTLTGCLDRTRDTNSAAEFV